MNELKKTGIFWAVTAVMLLIATVIAWPTADSADSGSLSELVGTPLIGSFKDPLAVASMKIVSFDENEGTLSNFEVAKEADSGDWTIVSRKGYPADAVEQVTNAANSLIDLKVLDVVPCTREDHDDLGVVEPKLEDLKIGDEGVGRLVTFKDADKQTIASIIIGDRVKDSDEQINVRIPGQDPVYIVALDDKPLTTKFQDWIEEDLLKLSTIDVNEIVTKDYSASLGSGGQIALQRNFNAQFAKDGSQWELAKLLEFDPKRPTAQPEEVEVEAEKKVNAAKLKDIENALDDLKIVNVLRKPDGMSANLRASEDFLSDQKAVASLAGRGFYPVQLTADGGTEILSANGEMTVGLKDGVEYVLRFGNIAGLGEEDSDDESAGEEDGDGEKKSNAGVNRYLLVTTRVDESKFPAPELQEVPQTLDDLKKLDEAEAKKNAPPETGDEEKPAEAATEDAAEEGAPSEPKEEMKSEEAAESGEETSAEKELDGQAEKEAEMPEESPAEAEPAEEKAVQEDTEPKPASEEKPADETGAKESGETETEGSESATATGQALQEVDDEKEASDEKETDKEGDADQKPEAASNEDDAEKASDTPADEEKTTTDDADKEMKSETEEPADATEPEETEEEKQERLEGLQEKITKENQRKMDERKDNLAKAKNRVRDLNARFADWYYVIPEDTYSKLTIKRNELFEEADEAGNSGSAPPSFQVPGAAGGFPGLPGN